jgi:hypothetical protein
MSDITDFQNFCETQAKHSTDGTRGLRLDAAIRCQHRAEVDGLVIALGQDEVQRIMAAAFAKHPYLTDNQFYESIQGRQALWQKRGQQAAQSTWDAVQYALRTDGLKALAANEQRLRDFSSRQLQDLIGSLSQAKAEEALLRALVEMLPDGPARTG